eukprot:1161394-Pelagomonas_calceolata.AAC.1
MIETIIVRVVDSCSYYLSSRCIWQLPSVYGHSFQFWTFRTRFGLDVVGGKKGCWLWTMSLGASGCLGLRTGSLAMVVFYPRAIDVPSAKSVSQAGLFSFKQILAACNTSRPLHRLKKY